MDQDRDAVNIGRAIDSEASGIGASSMMDQERDAVQICDESKRNFTETIDKIDSNDSVSPEEPKERNIGIRNDASENSLDASEDFDPPTTIDTACADDLSSDTSNSRIDDSPVISPRARRVNGRLKRPGSMDQDWDAAKIPKSIGLETSGIGMTREIRGARPNRELGDLPSGRSRVMGQERDAAEISNESKRSSPETTDQINLDDGVPSEEPMKGTLGVRDDTSQSNSDASEDYDTLTATGTPSTDDLDPSSDESNSRTDDSSMISPSARRADRGLERSVLVDQDRNAVKTSRASDSETSGNDMTSDNRADCLSKKLGNLASGRSSAMDHDRDGAKVLSNHFDDTHGSDNRNLRETSDKTDPDDNVGPEEPIRDAEIGDAADQNSSGSALDDSDSRIDEANENSPIFADVSDNSNDAEDTDGSDGINFAELIDNMHPMSPTESIEDVEVPANVRRNNPDLSDEFEFVILDDEGQTATESSSSSGNSSMAESLTDHSSRDYATSLRMEREP